MTTQFRYTTLMQSPLPRQLMRGLVGYWPLYEASGTRRDVVGGSDLTDNNTVTGNPGPSGRLPLASQFTRANSESLTVADNPAISIGVGPRMTFCGWVYKDSTPAGIMVIAGQWWGSGQNNTAYQIYWSNSTNTYNFVVSNDGIDTANVSATTFGAPANGAWQFIAAWYDGARIYISVNDGAADSAAWTNGIFDSTAELAFGCGELVRGNFWDGRQAYWGLWKGRVLEPREITYMHNRGDGRQLYGSAGFR